MSLVKLTRDGPVAILELQNGKVNALSKALRSDMATALSSVATDKEVGAVIICGSAKAFSAGVDITEMKALNFAEAFKEDFLRPLADMIQNVRVPVIAAVSGYALGGGFEMAMACDTIYAGESATFGQPEIKIGTMPGAGGSQRLIRAIGKPKAMDLILTGRSITAKEAFEYGVVARVVPDDKLLETAIEAAKVMSSYSRPIVMMAKEAVNAAEETSLTQGLLYERRLYYTTFDLEDSNEGMAAFIEKRAPNYRNC
ncbi:enoyl-CoA hydratase [Clavulina sp. PMI_390]|nr:enoyl-CoA hydratase [Clavulina sp. PMI_390]